MTTPQDPRSLDAIIDSLDESPSQTPPQEEYMAMMREEYMAMMREANSPETKDRNLRDWFAGMALQGLLANPGGPIQANGMSGWGWTNCDQRDVVQAAFGIADDMLAARKEAK